MALVARRQILFAVGALLAFPSLVFGQQTGKVVRIGWLGNSRIDTSETRATWDAFRLELQRRGWEEGRNIQFEQRFAAGNSSLFPQYAHELVDAKVDLILATTGSAAKAAKEATTSVPVVFTTVPNPVEIGLVASLARPGGNLTGFSTEGVDLVGKRLQLLKETFPHISHVGFLPSQVETIDAPAFRAAEKLGIQLMPVDMQQASGLSSAIATMTKADAWFVVEKAAYFANRKIIIDSIARQRKPAMYPSTFFVDAGGLMSYSVAQKDHYRGAAVVVDRILRGAKPADLPVEQPTKFELAINIRAAKALGLTIPRTILLRADRVIE